jgi:hypothetical protein
MRKKFWKNISTSIFFFISSFILIVSEFTPWINQLYSPWDLYQILSERVYVYLFPLISSSIVIVLGILLLLQNIIKIKKVVISIIAFIAQSLNTLFLIEMFTENGIEINSFNYGVFLGIGGFALLFWGLFWLLIQESTNNKQSG